MEESKNPIQVADRLFGAMEYLADHESASLMEVAEHLELNKSTAHRVLMSLSYMGYVSQNKVDGRYELTYKVVEVARKLMQDSSVVRRVHPYLQQLMRETGETVHLVQRDGSDVLYIDKVEATGPHFKMGSSIGSRIPMYCSGVGKAIAATLSDPEVEEIWAGSDIKNHTSYTITDYSEFQKTLAEVKTRGYALDNEENETGIRCIAVSLPLAGSTAEYAFSISAPIGRMPNSRIAELSVFMLETKKQIISAQSM